MVYQEPGRALNPSLRVGRQVAEVYEIAGLDRATRDGALGGDPEHGADLRPGRGHAPLPASALGRDAAAGRDRDGARVGAGAARARRADDGARRHRRGRGARPGGRPARRVLDVGALHQPQPGRDRAHVRPRRGALRRRAGRGGHGRARCSRAPRHPYTVGLLRCIPRRGRRKDHGRLDTIPGFLPAARPRRPRAASSPPRCALADDRCRTESPPPYDVGPGRTLALPPPRAGPRAAARDAGRPAGAATVREAGDAGGEPARRVEDVHASTASACAGSSTSTSTSAPARRSASSASRAAARPRSPASSWA